MEELKKALVDNLKSSGAIAEVEAKLKSEMLTALGGPSGVMPPPVSGANVLLNELIREYLSWNGYKGAEAVLRVETGGSDERLPRSLLADQLGLVDEAQGEDKDGGPMPLLYGILALIQKQSSGSSS